MSFNSVGQYTPSHKAWDHVGNMFPDIGFSEGQTLSVEYKPAAWLPVKIYEKYYENWVVCPPGKVVALDPDGRVMPAEYGLTSASVTYTADDVAAGVTDVATGEAVTTAKTVVLAALDGTRGSAWTKALAGTVNNASYKSGFMGRFGVSFVDGTYKYPVGVAPYAYLQWAGGDGSNPANLIRHNYMMQQTVAALADYVIKLPWIPAQAATETVDKTATSSNLVFGTRAVHTRAYAIGNSTGRYNSTYGSVKVLATYPVIALALDNLLVATNTARTTITMQSTNTADDVSGILVNERSALSAVTAAGDYFVDYTVGVVFIYSFNGSTVPTAISTAAGTVSITYYHYASSASTLSQYACVLGALAPGDFLIPATGSNLTAATTEDFKKIVGQVVGFETYPRDALDRVRTAYSPALSTSAAGTMANATAGSASVNLGQLDQMPGSATGGVTDAIHYAGAANQLVIINLVSR